MLCITLNSPRRGRKPRLTDVHFQAHTGPYGRDMQTAPRGDRQKVCFIPKTLKCYEWMLQWKSGKSSLQFLVLGKLCISHSILSADKPVVVDYFAPAEHAEVSHWSSKSSPAYFITEGTAEPNIYMTCKWYWTPLFHSRLTMLDVTSGWNGRAWVYIYIYINIGLWRNCSTIYFGLLLVTDSWKKAKLTFNKFAIFLVRDLTNDLGLSWRQVTRSYFGAGDLAPLIWHGVSKKYRWDRQG